MSQLRRVLIPPLHAPGVHKPLAADPDPSTGTQGGGPTEQDFELTRHWQFHDSMNDHIQILVCGLCQWASAQRTVDLSSASWTAPGGVGSLGDYL